MQTPLPSLMFNVFFVASAGLYANFLFHHYQFTPVDNFWLLYLYCCIGLSVIYLVKFVGLKICGWLFNMQQAADSYIFIVFIINKVIGISVLPFLILLAFTDGINLYSQPDIIMVLYRRTFFIQVYFRVMLLFVMRSGSIFFISFYTSVLLK